MKLPNKVITYNEGIISKFPIILNMLDLNSYSIFDLYNKLKKHIEDINEFLDILDCLYALGRINFDNENRRICYVM
jgi:hypothetical protein